MLVAPPVWGPLLVAERSHVGGAVTGDSTRGVGSRCSAFAVGIVLPRGVDAGRHVDDGGSASTAVSGGAGSGRTRRGCARRPPGCAPSSRRRGTASRPACRRGRALGEPRHLAPAERGLDRASTWSSDGDDAPGRDAERHQPHEVVPDQPPGGPLEQPALGERRQPVPEEHLGAVDVADPGEHRLVHEQLGDGSRGAVDARPGDVGVGVGAQRVGPEPVEDGVDLLGLATSHRLGPRRSATCCSVAQAQPHLADGRHLARSTRGCRP